ncbi:Uncharacterized protein BP5553_01366 [Venustampulla echinocandica]|uniref:Phosphatidylglycerol lysyltransferase C-terminal domain-containing protein n=1 Tax=Venustampulla echinocandica TaxID=2656787 RepID=A0A370U0U4_9HELO|nr:Uncharacterized protein BP5553_01366 [Venustampulla echinocandica]RDL41387.1 Uncharacterized protein BP5553_01366 [Venustampulla echinocandica]
MASVNGAESLSPPQSEIGQKSKKSKKKSSNPQRPAASNTPETKLFEQLGRNMIDNLIEDLQAPHDTPTLLDRLRDLGVISVQSSLTVTPPIIKASVEKGYPPGFQHNVFQTANPDKKRGTVSSPKSGSSTSPSVDLKTLNKTKDGHSNVFTLGDFAAVEALSNLADGYGRVSHMGILDGSYSFFVTKALNAALYFKVKDNICLVGGDPLCPEELYSEVLEQFAQYRRKHNWGIIFVGASDIFISYAKEHKWTTIQFGSERVLNPVTNPVLNEETAKRIVSQNRQLLNPTKGGVTLGVYNPSTVKNIELQQKLVAVYDAWRDARNQSQDPQAFITVYDPFAITGLMTYVYTMDRTGVPNGFAALRRIGANNGFHVDPCVAAPSAPRGISDLLIFSSMALLNAAGCSYLSFGYEPLTQSGEISGMPAWMQRITRKTHKSVFEGLKVSGKKGYHDKWCPDEEQRTGLHLVFPAGVPGLQDIIAVMHFANISVRSLAFARLKKMLRPRKREKKSTEEKASTEKATVGKDAAEKPANENPTKVKVPGEGKPKGKTTTNNPATENTPKKKKKNKKISPMTAMMMTMEDVTHENNEGGTPPDRRSENGVVDAAQDGAQQNGVAETAQSRTEENGTANEVHELPSGGNDKKNGKPIGNPKSRAQDIEIRSGTPQTVLKEVN